MAVKDDIYLMPLGTTKEEVIDIGKSLVEICKKEGYKLTPRLHTIYWGKKRGV